MISEGGRHTASSDIWLTSLKKKKKIQFLLTKYLFMGFSMPLKRQNLERNRKKKQNTKKQLKIVTHLPWNVNKLFLENMGQAII